MNRMFHSATVKLTLSYMAIITAICIGFSAVIYHFATSELHHGLTSQSERIINDFPGFNFNPALRPDHDWNLGAHHILLRLVYFNIVVLIFTGFASYALARRTLRPIQESHEQQKRFTADVSHELRTPLTALKMATEVALMDKSASKPELRDALASNLEEAHKLEALINNLFKLTRLEASEVEQYFSSVAVRQVIADAVTDVQSRADQKNIRLETDIGKQEVLGDRSSLTQLITILLDNAIKYSPEKSVVKLSSTIHDGTVKIAVEDSGMGIESAALQHVFDRFYRADKARTKTDTNGFGLGLSIAKLITDVHHGTITIRSQAGVGTHVDVSLPSAASK